MTNNLFSSMSSIYRVVEFTEEFSSDGKNPVDVIPSCWFTNAEEVACYWPRGGASTVVKLAQQQACPDPKTWLKCTVRALGSAGEKAMFFGVGEMYNLFL